MDQQQARELIEKSGFLLFIDVPVGTEIGIDSQRWSIGEKFKGIKMIPEGIHFIHFRPCSRSQESNTFSPATGFFLKAKKGSVCVRKWDVQSEQLCCVDSDEEERYAIAVRRMEFDVNLAPYPTDLIGDWHGLSQFISAKVLDRLDPIHKLISSAPLDLQALHPNTDQKFTTNTTTEHTETPFFTPIPARKFPKNCTPQEISFHSMDTTYLLTWLVRRHYQNDYNLFLGELQYSFVVFLLAETFEGFEQWKKMLVPLASAEALMIENPTFYCNLLQVLYFQLAKTPEDFFVDPMNDANFLVVILKKLFERLSGKFLSVELKLYTQRFKELTNQRFGQQFDSHIIEEDDEDAPTIVEL